MWEVAGCLLLAAGVWFLWDSLQAREAANARMRAACRERGYLFLDDTVALERLRPARGDDGRVRLRRVYRFEYSETGHDREPGRVTMLGAVVERVDVGRPDLTVVPLQ